MNGSLKLSALPHILLRRENGISAFINETLENSRPPLPHYGDTVKRLVCELEAESHQTLNLTVPESWTSQSPDSEKYISVVYKPAGLWDSATAAWKY